MSDLLKATTLCVEARDNAFAAVKELRGTSDLEKCVIALLRASDLLADAQKELFKAMDVPS